MYRNVNACLKRKKSKIKVGVSCLLRCRLPIFLPLPGRYTHLVKFCILRHLLMSIEIDQMGETIEESSS